MSVTIRIAPSNITDIWSNDASYNTSWPTSNSYANDGLNFGVAVYSLAGSDWSMKRTLLAFDTSSIPKGVKIVSVNLSAMVFTKAQGFGSDATDIEVRKYSWAPPGSAGNRETYYDGVVAAEVDGFLLNTNANINDVRFVSSNLDPTRINRDGLTCYGLVANKDVLPKAYTSPTARGASVSFYGMLADPELRPYLDVTYRKTRTGRGHSHKFNPRARRSGRVRVP